MTAQVVRITISDPNNPDPLRIGRVFVGPAWQPSKNFDWGYRFTARDETKKLTTPTGQSLIDGRPVIPGVEFQLNHIPRAEMLANGYELRRVLGLSRECLVCLDPEADDHLESHLIYGTFTDLSEFQPPYYEGWQMRCAVEALL
jgi:hypothetical protein